MVSQLLFLLPGLIFISAFLLYSQKGKREFFHFDLIQFLYAFLFAPLAFIWLKTILFQLFRDTLKLGSLTQFFLIDTLYSLIFIFTYAFIVIHSLTKSFDLKKKKDPLYDLFAHSEFFHRWPSHFFVFLGIMALFALISLVNLYLPFPFPIGRLGFYLIICLAAILSLLGYLGIQYSQIWLGKKFTHLINFSFVIFSSLHLFGYFFANPPLDSFHLVYWFNAILFASLTNNALFLSRFSFFKKIVQKFNLRLKEEFKNLPEKLPI